MASGYVGTASDVYEMLKKDESTQNTITQIQNMFGVQEKQLEQQTAYDISSAYANYKKQQLSLMQNQKLASGFKNKLDNVMYNDYTTQYSNIGNEYASDIAKLEQQKQTAIADINEAVYEQAENLNRLDELLLSYGQFTGEITDLSQIDKPYGAIYDDQTGLTGLGFYEVDENGQRNLTDLGKDFYAKMLYGPNGGAKFVDWLNKEDEKLASFYKENQRLVNKYIAGLDEDVFDYSEDMAKATNTLRKQKELYNFAKTEYNIKTDNKSFDEIRVETIDEMFNKYSNEKLFNQPTVSRMGGGKGGTQRVANTTYANQFAKDLTSEFSALSGKNIEVSQTTNSKGETTYKVKDKDDSSFEILIFNNNSLKKAIDQIAKLNK